MNFTERKRKIDYLLELINKNKCITPDQVAQKFGCSARTVKRMIAILREEGHNIKFCKISSKYVNIN
jgi:predicted DNA-binding transcriptional regulator YafY